MTGFNSYILCTAPRSGSTLLCRLLADTGSAGKPDSLFHRPSLADWCAGLNLAPQTPLSQIFTAAQKAGRAGTPVFGLRLQQHSAPFFLAQLATLYPTHGTDHARITAAFGSTRYIHLTRTDKVAQAVSLLRAEQSGLWHRAPDGTEIERTGPAREPTYDARSIAQHVATLKDYDTEWNRWFAAQSITPHRITYDDLSNDPKGALADVLASLNLDPALAAHVTPGTARLADATSTAWIRKFKDTNGNP